MVELLENELTSTSVHVWRKYTNIYKECTYVHSPGQPYKCMCTHAPTLHTLTTHNTRI